MGVMRRQLEYKSRWKHTKLTPRSFPSSKIFHVSLHRNAKLKREREWRCPNCGSRHERSLNAAVNLRNLILPPGRGPMLRDGRAIDGASSAGGTVSHDRRTGEQRNSPSGVVAADCVLMNVNTPYLSYDPDPDFAFFNNLETVESQQAFWLRLRAPQHFLGRTRPAGWNLVVLP